MKFESKNHVKSGLFQSLLSSVPILVFSIVSKINAYQGYLKASYSLVLAEFFLVMFLLVWKINRNIKLPLKVVKYFTVLSIFPLVSILNFFQNPTSRIIYNFCVLLISVFFTWKLWKNAAYSSEERSETTELPALRDNIDLFRMLFYPFEIFLENTVIIPASATKKYSLSKTTKRIFSPLLISILSILHFKPSLSIQKYIILSLVPLSCTLILVMSSHIRKIAFLMSIYSFSVCSLIYFCIFDLVLQTSSNLVHAGLFSPYVAIILLIIPQIALPYFYIFKHFIKIGFLKKSLYSAFYSVNSNVLLINFVEVVCSLNANAQPFSLLFDENFLKITIMSIFILQNLVVGNICAHKGKFARRNLAISGAVLLQDWAVSFYLERSK